MFAIQSEMRNSSWQRAIRIINARLALTDEVYYVHLNNKYKVNFTPVIAQNVR